MDYEVFLVSRMREEYAHRTEAREAVRQGFAHSDPSPQEERVPIGAGA